MRILRYRGDPLLVVDTDSALHPIEDGALLAQLQPHLDEYAAVQDKGGDPPCFVLYLGEGDEKRQHHLKLCHLIEGEQVYYFAVLQSFPLSDEVFAAAYYHNIATLFPHVAHEIRGDLNGIVINLELLKGEITQAGGGLSGSEGSLRYAEIAIQSVYSLNRALHSLFELIQALNEPIKVFDVVKLLDDIQTLTAAQAKSQRTAVFYNIPEGPILIKGRPGQLRQALLTLMLHVMRKLSSEAKLSLQAREQEDALVIEVRIYKPSLAFLQDEKTKVGAEVGLKVSVASIEAHGGGVWFQRDLNSIYIRIPL